MILQYGFFHLRQLVQEFCESVVWGTQWKSSCQTGSFRADGSGFPSLWSGWQKTAHDSQQFILLWHIISPLTLSVKLHSEIQPVIPDRGLSSVPPLLLPWSLTGFCFQSLSFLYWFSSHSCSSSSKHTATFPQASGSVSAYFPQPSLSSAVVHVNLGSHPHRFSCH